MRVKITVEKIPDEWDKKAGYTDDKLTFETTIEKYLEDWTDFWEQFYLFLGYEWGSIQEMLAKLDWG